VTKAGRGGCSDQSEMLPSRNAPLSTSTTRSLACVSQYSSASRTRRSLTLPQWLPRSLRRSAEARAAYIAGAGASKDQLEELVADETHSLIGHYRIVRGVLYKGFGTASELGDGNSLALLAGRLHENFRDCGRLTGELQRGPLLSVQNNVLINPDYTRAIARIVSAVGRYPEARDAVVAALRDLDAASASAPALIDRRSGGAEVDG